MSSLKITKTFRCTDSLQHDNLMIDAKILIARNPAFLFTETEGEYVLMSIETGKYYLIEHTASRIWELLEKPASVSELVQTLNEEYEVNIDQCQTEVTAFIEQLLSKGLLMQHKPE